MRGPYSEYAAPPIYIRMERPRPGIRFSRVEIVQLTIAVLALTGALTLLNGLPVLRSSLPPETLGLLLGIVFASSLVAVATGVGLHEIAHKAVAQRYGHWAEFRYYPLGLVMAFVFAFLGFIYGAPGATLVSGAVSREENGRISAAGPATNLVLGAAFLAGASLLTVSSLSDSLALVAVFLILRLSAFMNIILAGFNMIPVPPFDGSKVWSWNKPVFFAIVGIVIALFVIGFYADILFV